MCADEGREKVSLRKRERGGSEGKGEIKEWTEDETKKGK